ncbi:cytochrome P450 [Gongronella butleri]|nr:cytochrome P450 [Gongronella butleri]
MSEKTLVVALKGSSLDSSKSLHLAGDVRLDTVRQLAADALGIRGIPANDLLLYDASGHLLGGIDDVFQQQVVYVDVQGGIDDVFPGPKPLPFVGNLYDLLPNIDTGFMKLHEKYGPVVDITLFGNRFIGTNDPYVAEEFLKENEYFTKKIVPSSLTEARKFAGTGLFTSDTDAQHWKLAHKLLMPAFSPRAIKAYQEEMGAITSQTISILDQFKPGEDIDILDWTTKVTFEAIGRIGFGYDFGLLDAKEAPPHPMIVAMKTLLQLTTTRAHQMDFMKRLPTSANRQFDESTKIMHDSVLEVVRERKNGKDARDSSKDLLGFMLNARDELDEGLTDENIRDQVVTFLIAGHDTTANTLAWFFYELARHPHVQAKVLQEIANAGITSDELPTVEQINSLKYTLQAIYEVLRLYAPVRKLTKYCRQDCVVPHGYKIPANTALFVNVYSLHHNEKFYPNPFEFDPDRFAPEEEQKRPAHAWVAFSTGPRGCIGRAFAIQEARTVIAMLLHKFEFKYDGPPVEMDNFSATTKPANLTMTIHKRVNFPAPTPDASLPNLAKTPTPARVVPSVRPGQVDADKQAQLPNVTFLFGTQTGVSQDYANQLYNQAKEFGFLNVQLLDIDKWQGYQQATYTPPANKKELIVICTATYSGSPPENAEKFDRFLDKKLLEPGHEKHFEGVMYAVFGVGNKNWRTYQKFPIKVDEALGQLGATRFFARGEGNTDEDVDSDFNVWSAHFWMSTLDGYGLSASVDKPVVPVESTSKVSSANIKVRYLSPQDPGFQQGDDADVRYGGQKAYITVNRELQQPGSGRSTRHIELDVHELTRVANAAPDALYVTGDHLEVLPLNSTALVESIGLHFGWILDSVFEVDDVAKQSVSPRSLAGVIKGPCSIRNALTKYADLTGAPSRLLLHCFAQELRRVTDDATADAFERQIVMDAHGNDPYPAFIQAHRTLLDVVRAFPQVKHLDFGQFLAAAGVMQPRRYSIASSPLADKNTAALTIGVVNDLVDGRHYPGFASSYLAALTPNPNEPVAIRAAFKSAKSSFALPTDPSVPILMISAGTGISPFMGFLQERSILKQQGHAVGATTLFFGCRHPEQDFIYKDQLAAYQSEGVLTALHVAFSRQETGASTYVQHQILLHAADVFAQMQPTNGAPPAIVYVCGSGKMSRDVRNVFVTMTTSFGAAETDEEADKLVQEWVDQGRYNEDVWG